MRIRTTMAAVAVGAMAVSGLAACGGSSGGGGGGGTGDSSGAARGPITYVQGKDNNNILGPIADMWNKDHPNEKVTIVQQTDQADQQHDDLVQNFQAGKNGKYDVVTVDVIWTAEFAAKGYLQPLTGQYKLDTSNLLDAPVKTATYAGKLYGGPYASDGGLLYYRKDLFPTPPTTWDELQSDCAMKKSKDCYVGQFAKYEGLTVNASEAINAAGGHLLNDSGKPDVDTDAAKKGMDFLTTMFSKGYIPSAALSYQEEQSLNDFENGNAAFLRNWPYAYSLLGSDAASKVKGKFAVAPLPGPNGTGASTLGGHNVAISSFSKHKQTALDFIKFLESESLQKFIVQKASLAPVISSLYTDSSLTSQYPYLPTLLKSIQSAVPRPVTPYYPAVTAAVESNIYAILQKQVSVDTGLSNLQKALSQATAG